MASRRFPAEKIEVVPAEFSGALRFHTGLGGAPRIEYSFGLHLAPREAFGAGHPTSILLSSLQLRRRDWTELVGTHPQSLPSDNCTVYLAGLHNPVDVHGLELLGRRGARFDAEFSLLLDFEFAGAPYRNVGVRIQADCAYTGLTFHAPEPGRRHPAGWHLPDEYTPKTVSSLMERFVDVDRYEAVERDGRWFSLRPRLH